MASLKDLLREGCMETLASSVKRGDIVRMWLTEAEGVTPKNKGDNGRNKYFVVLGKTSDGKLIGFTLINSNVNKRLDERLRMLHYPITKSRYPFLDHDSFVYCGQLKEIELSSFTDRYNGCIHGRLNDEDLALVIDAVISSPSETRKHLRKFGLIP